VRVIRRGPIWATGGRGRGVPQGRRTSGATRNCKRSTRVRAFRSGGTARGRRVQAEGNVDDGHCGVPCRLRSARACRKATRTGAGRWSGRIASHDLAVKGPVNPAAAASMRASDSRYVRRTRWSRETWINPGTRRRRKADWRRCSRGPALRRGAGTFHQGLGLLENLLADRPRAVVVRRTRPSEFRIEVPGSSLAAEPRRPAGALSTAVQRLGPMRHW